MKRLREIKPIINLASPTSYQHLKNRNKKDYNLECI